MSPAGLEQLQNLDVYMLADIMKAINPPILVHLCHLSQSLRWRQTELSG